MRFLLLLVLFVCSPALAEVQSVGKVGHGPLSEISGIVKSENYPDTYWVHNDSGDSPRLFAIEQDGSVIVPPFVKNKQIGEEESELLWQGMPVYVAANQDWEDIAVEGDLIYIADVGNNGNARRDLGVYVVREPNPKAITNARSFKYFPVQYPDQKQFPAKQWHFDSESLFIADGKIYFVTKHRQPGKISDWERGAKLYRLDNPSTDEVNTLTLVGQHEQVSVATGADVSPNGEWLAVIGYADIWLFKKPDSGDDWLSGESYRLPLDFQQTGQVEAIAWQDDEQLLFTNEPGALFQVSKAAILNQ